MRTRERSSLNFLFALFFRERGLKTTDVRVVAASTSLFDYFLGDLGVNYAWQPLTNFGRLCFLYWLRLCRSCFAKQMEEKFNYTWLILMQQEILCIYIIRKTLLIKCLIWFFFKQSQRSREDKMIREGNANFLIVVYSIIIVGFLEVSRLVLILSFLVSKFEIRSKQGI